MQRHGEQEHAAVGVDRLGDLGVPVVATRNDPVPGLLRERRREREPVVLDVGRGRALARVAQHLERRRRLAEQVEDRDARIGPRGRRLGEVGIGDAERIVLELLPQNGRDALESLELRLRQVVLEGRDDGEVDGAERAGDDDCEREREPRPDALERIHRSRKR